MNEGDPRAKAPEQTPDATIRSVVGESGVVYETTQVLNKALGILTDHLVSDGPQPATLAEGE